MDFAVEVLRLGYVVMLVVLYDRVDPGWRHLMVVAWMRVPYLGSASDLNEMLDVVGRESSLPTGGK